ncbi:MAG: asparagine synthase-related protein [Wenzhouxiangella sp.]
MAFSLASGRFLSALEREAEGRPSLRCFSPYPDAFLAVDALSKVAQTPNDAGGWLVVIDGYLDLDGREQLAAQLNANTRKPPAPNDDQPAAAIAQLLANKGPDALHALSGCFVILAVHGESRRIVLLRDRTGGRTAYWHGQNGDWLIDSHSHRIQHHSGQAFTPDPHWTVHFFSLATSHPPGHSAFENIHECLPGELMQFQDGKIQRHRPALNLEADFDYRNPGDCVDRFRELFERAVASCLPADGPVACMLSGGLDSGPTAMVADRRLAEHDRRLVICSWRLDQYPDADERHWIELAGEKLREPPQPFEASHLLPFSNLSPEQVGGDTPYLNAFRPLKQRCYQKAAEAGCKIILNANAGDELYPHPRFLQIDRIRRGHWAAIWRDLRQQWQRGRLSGLTQNPSNRGLAASLLKPLRPPRPPAWLSPVARDQWQAPQPWPPECQSHRFPEQAWQLLGSQMASGRAHESEFPARFGVERRDPFHNEALQRFMLNAPHSLSRRQGVDKWIMRAATRGLLPDPLRRKGRTGLLNPFFNAGFMQHRDAIRQRLDQQAGWQHWIRRDYVERAITIDPPDRSALVANHCLGFGLWQSRHSA